MKLISIIVRVAYRDSVVGVEELDTDCAQEVPIPHMDGRVQSQNLKLTQKQTNIKTVEPMDGPTRGPIFQPIYISDVDWTSGTEWPSGTPGIFQWAKVLFGANVPTLLKKKKCIYWCDKPIKPVHQLPG